MTSERRHEISKTVEGLARQDRADLFGVAPVEVYAEYLAAARQIAQETGAGSGEYMIAASERDFFGRIADPTKTLASVRSIVLIGAYAYDESAVFTEGRTPHRGKIARTYSYYPVVRNIAERIVAFLRERGYEAIAGQDVPLKYLADRIGLGGYGWNAILLTKDYGSYVALRAVLTDADLEPMQCEPSSPCVGCGQCLEACPTGALYDRYKVDPRRCINPITRRDKPIGPETRVKMGCRVHGCDVCQEVCPVNRRLKPRPPDRRACFDPEHHASHQGLGGLERRPKLLDLIGSDRPFNIRRNAAIALGNVAGPEPAILEALQRSTGDVDPNLREYFEWAIERIVARS